MAANEEKAVETRRASVAETRRTSTSSSEESQAMMERLQHTLASSAIRDYFPEMFKKNLSKHIKMRFVAWDTDGSGALDKGELTEAMAAMGHRPSPQEVDKLMRSVDHDGNGTVELDEFEHMVREAMATDLEECGCRMCCAEQGREFRASSSAVPEGAATDTAAKANEEHKSPAAVGGFARA
ncbi:hypothetical protein T484DRAFT_1936098 [Baffinella frigidus]|nr:hypothetical protein T484DRAFT_1936098 [Cryptophyta sp. CCMP2293]